MIYVIYIAGSIVGLYFLTMLLVSIGFLIGRNIQKNKKVSRSFELKYSILIAFRNEEHIILNCLESLKDLNYPKDKFEVILVNDSSNDKGPIQVNEFIGSNPDLSIGTIDLSDAHGKKKALERGVGLAKYEHLVTTDADCVVSRDWLIEMNKNYTDDADMIIGPVKMVNGSGFLGAFQILDFLALQGTGLGGLMLGYATMSNGANMSFKKGVYSDLGGHDGFNTPSGDDVFLMQKFSQNRKLIVPNICRKSIVETTVESSWRDLFSQRKRWASKSKFYASFSLLYLGFLVVFSNLLLLFFYVGAALVEKYAEILLFLALSKWLIDFILLFLVASFYQQKKTLWYFVPVQLMYPFYIIAVWVASITTKYQWKGRTYNG